MKRILSVAVALAFMAVATTGCKKKEEKKAEPAKTEAKKEEKKAEPAAKKEEKKAEPAKAEPAAGGAIGIKACDDYISKYMACVKKMPQAAQAGSVKAFTAVQDAWKKAAASGNDATKKALADGCTKAHEMAKKAMAAYKCEW